MATKKITFDPTSGVPYAANLSIFGGSNFSADFTVVDTGNAAFDFSGANAVGIATTTGWTGSSQMRKSAAIGSGTTATATFVVGIDTTSATAGKFTISLGSTATRSIAEGRYVYDVLVSSGATVYRIADGNIMVRGGVSSAP